MSGAGPARASGRAWALRALFLAAVVGSALWSLRGRWGEVWTAMRAVPAPSLVAAVALTALGLAATFAVWRRLLHCCGHRIAPAASGAVFFVSQLGKYVPGGVWAIGVQARLSAAHAVPVRTSVGVALLFTWVHVVSAVVLGSGLVLAGAISAPGPRPLWALALAGALVLAVPAWWRPLLRRAAGAELRVRAADAAVVAAGMALAWALYVAALTLLLPGAGPRDVADLAGAFALGYAAGVLAVLAPAGLGAREAVFVAMLSPATGLPAATAVALLARVVHTAADFLLAALAAAIDGVRNGALAAAAGRGRRPEEPGSCGLSVAPGSVRRHDDHRL